MWKETAVIAPEIPIEIVSDEEMSVIEAALASTSHRTCYSLGRDIEDGIGNSTQKESLLHRFKRKSGLFVTDITSTEWCEKQKEFFLVCGKPKASEAMKAGSARHALLEQEVITKVEVVIRSAKEHWALKMINFIHGTNQLFLDGLTRELPLIGFAEDVCVVGVIDEIRRKTGTITLVETKTRSQNNLPSEAQQRNGRLQLMCYKYLWDSLLAHPFPTKHFLQLFSLKPDYMLSQQMREFAMQAGAPVQPKEKGVHALIGICLNGPVLCALCPRLDAKLLSSRGSHWKQSLYSYGVETLNDVIGKYQYVCSMLPETQDQLLLRYEYQKDQSLIGENQYIYDSDWVADRIRSSLEFWKGEREASYVLENERWKCKHCKYAPKCPVNTIST